MNLAREVLSVEVVLAGSVEVKLEEAVGLSANRGGAVDVDLDVGSQVLKLGTGSVRVDSEGEGGAANGVLLSVEVDGGLIGTGGAELVGVVKAVPVQSTAELMVTKDSLGSLDKVRRTGAEGGAVVAYSSSQGGK